MRFPFTLMVVLLGLGTSLPARDSKLLPAAPGAVGDANAPLPPGAVMRLGETRFRPGARITHLAFSPDGTQIASWGNWLYFEDRLSIWDVSTGKELRTHAVAERQPGGLCWGPDGRGFALVKTNDDSGGLNAFRLWSFTKPDDKLPPSPVPGLVVVGGAKQQESYHAFTLSADGTRLAAFRSGDVAGGSVDLFEAKSGPSLKDLKRIATRGSLPHKCLGLTLIRGGKALVILTTKDKAISQSVIVWDLAKDAASDPVTVPVGVRQGSRQAIDVADDGSALAVGLEDGTVKVFDLASGKERLSVKKHDGPKNGGKWSDVSAVKFVNGGRNVLSAGRDNRQIVWDTQTGADVAVLNGHGSWVEAVAVSPDGKRVATAGQDSLIRLWDATTWQPLVPPTGPRETVWRLEVSRDGKYAAAGCGTGVHVWEIASGREVRELPSDYRSGYVLFAPDGNVLTGDREGTLSLYATPKGETKPLAAKGRLLDFTPDGKALLTAQGNSVVIWDWPACTQRAAVAVNDEPLSAAISQDSKTAVIGLHGGNASIINLASGKAAGEMPFKLHWFSRVGGFAPTGRIVCGVGMSKVEAWNTVTRAMVGEFEKADRKGAGHFNFHGFAVTPDGRRSASSHSDGGVTVYETATGQALAHFHGHRDGAIGVALTPDGNRVLSGGGDHQVLVWDISLEKLTGKVDPLPASDRLKAWDQLGTLPAKEALKTIAALAAQPEAAVTLLASKLKPVPAADPAVLDRIFRDLDDAKFAVRDKAERELNELGAGAIGGVRARQAKGQSLELQQRSQKFLRKFDVDDMTPDRVRVARALEVLAAANTPGARRLVEQLAAGAAHVWETEAARQTLAGMTSVREK